MCIYIYNTCIHNTYIHINPQFWSLKHWTPPEQHCSTVAWSSRSKTQKLRRIVTRRVVNRHRSEFKKVWGFLVAVGHHFITECLAFSRSGRDKNSPPWWISIIVGWDPLSGVIRRKSATQPTKWGMKASRCIPQWAGRQVRPSVLLFHGCYIPSNGHMFARLWQTFKSWGTQFSVKSRLEKPHWHHHCVLANSFLLDRSRW